MTFDESNINDTLIAVHNDADMDGVDEEPEVIDGMQEAIQRDRLLELQERHLLKIELLTQQLMELQSAHRQCQQDHASEQVQHNHIVKDLEAQVAKASAEKELAVAENSDKTALVLDLQVKA